MDCSPPGSPVHGILQARMLEWVAFPSPENLPNPGIKPGFPALQADSLHKVSGPRFKSTPVFLQRPVLPISTPTVLVHTHPPFTHTHTHTHTLSAILTWLSMIFPPGSSPAEELSCLPAEDHCWSMRYGVYRTSPSDASGSFTPYFNSQWDPHPPCPQLHFLPCRLMERKSPGRGRWKATAPSFEGKGSL